MQEQRSTAFDVVLPLLVGLGAAALEPELPIWLVQSDRA